MTELPCCGSSDPRPQVQGRRLNRHTLSLRPVFMPAQSTHPRLWSHAAVKTDVEELSPTRVRLSVEVSFEELKPSLDKAYREVGRQVRIPGFRPGRVPPPVIDRRVGRDVVVSQAVNDAIPDLYAKAVADGD